MTEDGRDRLARIMEERRGEIGRTWDDVAAKGSTHAETLRQVRKHRREITRKIKRAIEEGLDWHTGSVDRVIAGGYPAPLPTGPDDLPGLPVNSLLAQMDWVQRQPWSAIDKQRVVNMLIELDQQAEQERRAS